MDKYVLETSIEVIGYNFSPQVFITNSKSNLIPNLASMIRATKGTICVAEDLDDRTHNTLRQHYEDSLRSSFPDVTNFQECMYRVGDNRVILIASGLENESTLQDFQLTRHTVEDHIVKVLLTDDTAIQKLSQNRLQKCSQLKDALLKLSDIQSKLGIQVESSKDIIDMAKMIMRFRTSPQVFAQHVIHSADKALLKDAIKDIDRLFTQI